MGQRYAGRIGISGNVTLNNSRKGGQSFTYWFFINMGRASCGRDKWLEFDVRDLARTVGKPIPPLMTHEEIKACSEDNDSFEILLRRDLQRVAEFCASVDAVRVLGGSK